MQLRSFLFCTLFAAIGASATLVAQPPAAPAQAQAGHDDDTPLGEKMGAMGKAFKKLRSQISDAAKNEDSLKLVAILRENAEAAMKLEPAKKADLPAADQAKFQADFVAKMKSFLADVAKLEDALKAGNNEDAKKLLEALNTDQKEGHKEFRKKKAEKK